MKRVIFMVDSAADFPYASLRDQTPLEMARFPTARALAREGKSGALKFTSLQSSHAMSCLGAVYEGQGLVSKEVRWGPLAARALGWAPDSARFRCLGHFMTSSEPDVLCPAFPGTLTEQEVLLREIEGRLRHAICDTVQLGSFGLGRFVLDMPLVDVGRMESLTPGDLKGKTLSKYLRRMPPPLQTVMEVAAAVLTDHAINQIRLDLGENPMNAIWLWSGGSLSGVTRHPEALRQGLMSCEPLALGLGKALGVEVLSMDDPYHLDRIDAAFDVAAFVEMMGRCDEVSVWVPGPFSRGQMEGPEEKVRRLDAIDYYILSPIRAVLDDLPEVRMLMLSAGIRHRGVPEKGRAPFVLWGDGIAPDDTCGWHERDALRGALGTPKLLTLFDILRRP